MLNILEIQKYVCSDYFDPGVPSKIAYLISLVINIIQIGVPILLIVWGMMDLGKAVIAQKEDEIKKGQNTFIKRLIAAALVFFVVVIVKLLIGLVATDSKGIIACIDEIQGCSSSECGKAAGSN